MHDTQPALINKQKRRQISLKKMKAKFSSTISSLRQQKNERILSLTMKFETIEIITWFEHVLSLKLKSNEKGLIREKIGDINSKDFGHNCTILVIEGT